MLALTNFRPQTRHVRAASLHRESSLRHSTLNASDNLSAKIAELEHCLEEVKSALLQAAPAERVPQPFLVEAGKIRRILAARRVREQQLGADLFVDPAWDLLLEAFAADLEQKPLYRSDLARAASVPETTAVRWLRKLEQDGWLRSSEESAGEPQLIELTLEGSTRLRRYFECVGPGHLLI